MKVVLLVWQVLQSFVPNGIWVVAVVFFTPSEAYVVPPWHASHRVPEGYPEVWFMTAPAKLKLEYEPVWHLSH